MNKLIVTLIAFALGCTNPSTGDDTDGLQGPKGDQGEQGPQGPKGDTGATGPAGPMGASGASGSTGATGAQGPAGLPGATGVTGPSGAPGAQGMAGPQGVAGPVGATGPTGAMGQQGPAGPKGNVGPAGPAGRSVIVLDTNGAQLGVPVAWRGANGMGETAVLMDAVSPAATFPQGWVIPETAPATIYYVGQNCIGAPLAKPPNTAPAYGPILYTNFLYWVPNHSTLYKKIGSVSTSAGSSRNTSSGSCMNSNVSTQAFELLEDSTFRMQFENTKPWTVAVQ